MQPQIRSCYNALLLDAEAPVLFPYGDFGSLLVAGELARDCQTFFAQRILSFLPDRRDRPFRAPLRRIDFLHDHAIYRDPTLWPAGSTAYAPASGTLFPG
jgi:hypothetical protein